MKQIWILRRRRPRILGWLPSNDWTFHNWFDEILTCDRDDRHFSLKYNGKKPSIVLCTSPTYSKRLTPYLQLKHSAGWQSMSKFTQGAEKQRFGTVTIATVDCQNYIQNILFTVFSRLQAATFFFTTLWITWLIHLCGFSVNFFTCYWVFSHETRKCLEFRCKDESARRVPVCAARCYG